MTYEEMERSMEFMRGHLVSMEQLQEESEQRGAKFEASIQRSIESIFQQQAKNTIALDRLVVLGSRLARRQLQTDKQLGVTNKQLADTAVQLAEIGVHLAHVVETQERLTESQQRTDARFKAFLSALERNFGRNGRGRKAPSS